MLAIEKFSELSKQVADQLGYTCSFNPDTSYSVFYAYLVQDDKELTLCNGQYGKTDRIVISGNYPKPIDGGGYYGKSTSITVTEKKDAAAIAKDIMKRFMPGYLEELATVLEHNKERNAEVNLAKNALEAVAEALGTRPRFQNNRGLSGSGDVWHNDLHSFHAVYRYNGEFEIKLAMPLTKVLDLVTFLKDPALRGEACISVSSEDIVEHCVEKCYTNEETCYLVDNLDTITDQVINYIQDTGWRRLFEEACDGYVTGYRMQCAEETVDA